jgi:hypothetical protein
MPRPIFHWSLRYFKHGLVHITDNTVQRTSFHAKNIHRPIRYLHSCKWSTKYTHDSSVDNLRVVRTADHYIQNPRTHCLERIVFTFEKSLILDCKFLQFFPSVTCRLLTQKCVSHLKHPLYELESCNFAFMCSLSQHDACHFWNLVVLKILEYILQISNFEKHIFDEKQK